MSTRRASAVRRWLERALLVVGLGCLGYYSYMKVEARHFQREQTQRLLQSISAQAPTGATSAAAASGASDRDGAAAPVAPLAPLAPVAPVAPLESVAPGAAVPSGVWALLEIPRLAISSPVMSGDEEKTLSVAVGHLSDTPLPWQRGNSAMAAHRDGLFRPLQKIRVGDDIRVRTAQGDFAYVVRKTRIVMPTDLSVLEPTTVDTLTLITCYPFDYVGPAPKRFIVHAERVDSRAEIAEIGRRR